MSAPTSPERIIDRDTGELLDLSPGGLCAACAGVGYTCCQPEYGVTITFHDAKRLRRKTGLALEEFCVINKLDDDELVEGLEVDPYFKKVFLGRRRLLQTVQRGLDCHFLGEGGCTIFEDRPRLCHFHPFWFRFQRGGSAAVFFDAIDDRDDADDSDCLVVKKLWPNIPLGLRSIGETPETLGFHAARMKEEIDWQSRQVKKLLKKLRPRDLTLEVLAPVIERAPLFEV